jgi:hypothetical protein
MLLDPSLLLTIDTTGVTTITTNTTPVITIDSDTDEGDTMEPDSKLQKTDHLESGGYRNILRNGLVSCRNPYINVCKLAICIIHTFL